VEYKDRRDVQTHEITEYFGKIFVTCEDCADTKRISAILGGLEVYCEHCKKYYGVRVIRGKDWGKK